MSISILILLTVDFRVFLEKRTYTGLEFSCPVLDFGKIAGFRDIPNFASQDKNEKLDYNVAAPKVHKWLM